MASMRMPHTLRSEQKTDILIPSKAMAERKEGAIVGGDGVGGESGSGHNR